MTARRRPKVARLATGPNGVAAPGDGLTLRVVWPVLDSAMVDREAMKEAERQWPGFLEWHQVRAVGGSLMRVVETNDHQRQAFGADRAVVCVASVVRRPPHAEVEE